MNTVDLSGLDRLNGRLRNIIGWEKSLPVLGEAWKVVIERDNRQGVLAGLDKDGLPMTPVTYRPKPPTKKRLTATQKNNPAKGARLGHFAGLGQHPAGLNNNLSSLEYRSLTGPPLAPRGAFSRVITNLRFRYGSAGGNLWETVGFWDEVVNVKGMRFLHYHFDGAVGGGRKRNVVLPRRDLRGVRPAGVVKARNAARAWAIDVIRSA